MHGHMLIQTLWLCVLWAKVFTQQLSSWTFPFQHVSQIDDPVQIDLNPRISASHDSCHFNGILCINVSKKKLKRKIWSCATLLFKGLRLRDFVNFELGQPRFSLAYIATYHLIAYSLSSFRWVVVICWLFFCFDLTFHNRASPSNLSHQIKEWTVLLSLMMRGSCPTLCI